MKLSVIIVNHNAKDILRECLSSVFKHLKNVQFEYEVFVVDNNSHDGSQAMIGKEFTGAKLLDTGENLGWSKGNNQAIKVALGEYILLLNPDTLIVEDSFRPMIDFMEKNKEVGVLGPKLIDADGKTWTSTESTPGPFMVFLRFCVPRFLLSVTVKKFIFITPLKKILGKVIRSYFSDPNTNAPIEVGNVSGACLLMRSKVIDQVGLLDENFFTYSDDIEWCLRAKKAGWKIIYFPGTKILHYGGKTTGREHTPTSFCRRVQGAFYYYKKHYDKSTVLKIRILLFCAMILKFPVILFYSFYKEKNNNLMKLYFEAFKKLL